jgi:aminobenzoyl-glutamate transport protein
VTFVIVFVSSRLIERRLGAYRPEAADPPPDGTADPAGAGTATEAAVDPAAESRGLRYAGLAVLAAVVVVLLLAVPPGGPLRNPETGSLVNDAPLMSSLIVIITVIFLVAGTATGAAPGPS